MPRWFPSEVTEHYSFFVNSQATTLWLWQLKMLHATWCYCLFLLLNAEYSALICYFMTIFLILLLLNLHNQSSTMGEGDSRICIISIYTTAECIAGTETYPAQMQKQTPLDCHTRFWGSRIPFTSSEMMDQTWNLAIMHIPKHWKSPPNEPECDSINVRASSNQCWLVHSDFL